VKYRVIFNAIATACVEVEADSLEHARKAAENELPGGLCYSCSGGKYDAYSVDMSDWESTNQTFTFRAEPDVEVFENDKWKTVKDA